MRRRHLPLILALFAGCGGAVDPLSIEIDTTRLGLEPTMTSAKVRIYIGEIDQCTLLYVGNKERPVVPLYEATVSVNAGAAQGRTSFNKIRPSTYMIGAWGYDQAGAEVAYGCATRVVIEEGVEAKAEIPMGLPPGK